MRKCRDIERQDGRAHTHKRRRAAPIFAGRTPEPASSAGRIRNCASVSNLAIAIGLVIAAYVIVTPSTRRNQPSALCRGRAAVGRRGNDRARQYPRHGQTRSAP